MPGAAMTERDLDDFLGARPRRRLARWGMVLALLAAGVAALWLFVRFVDGPELPYYTVPLERGSLTPALSATGTLHAEDEVILRAPQGGVVHSLLGPGDGVVRAGQPIAMLDTAPFEADLASAEATRAAAEGTLAAAQADVDGARARLERYDGVWRRSGGRVPSLNEMDGARAELSRTAAALATATAALAKARNDEVLARRRLADATIRAPFDGLVVARAVAPGQLVQPGMPLLSLATGLDRLVVTVPLPAADAQRLALNARARVLLSGMADKVRTARLVRIDPTDDTRGLDRLAVFALDPVTSGEGTPLVQLRPGMAATVEIDLPAREGVLLVPNAALGFTPEGVPSRNGAIYVVADDNEPRQVAVATGASDGKRTEVLASGLEPGVQVIIGRRAPGASPSARPAAPASRP
ncbi:MULTISPECIES: efflux RND transporter periplasmic adaptor subunit [unclassified Novosphingobium]|uniref:efflux RND transporter periplasmic adaptor subunit n=1 Tax=unclassified Novosphingobium TaxID=2644732 RepID=UPI00146F593B|nr:MULTISPECIES: efflux RND transporter periplasmic adaptor subunit [unclassified Novosphingobium]NMN06374.1 HlyD family secretion protein [Novosphingobium sp. SG919]NMN88672.1 HlyD family secretion protein [Novosphingobium sp. SG916]